MSVEQLDLASVEDHIAAVNTDGTPVDIYKVKAAKMFGVRYENVTGQQRQIAKRAAYLELGFSL